VTARARPVEVEPGESEAIDPGLHLQLRLGLLETQVRGAVAARREVDPNPDDAFRGLYVSDEHVDQLLAGGWPPMPPVSSEILESRSEIDVAFAAGGQASRLGRLAERFGLAPLDVDLFVVAIAPDLDGRFERLYGYLNDDVTKRRATIGLALELCGAKAGSSAAQRHLGLLSPLVAGGLVLVEDQDHPFLSRSLRVPDRVTAHLLGDDRPDPELAPLLMRETPPISIHALDLARTISAGAQLAYIRERSGTAGRALAVAALAHLGERAVDLDLTRLGPDADVAAIARAAGREARLIEGGVVAGPLEALASQVREQERAAVRAFAELDTTVLLLGRGAWDPGAARRVPLLIDAPMPGQDERLDTWSASIAAATGDGDGAGAEISDALAAFRLAPEQVARAAEAAHWQATIADAPLSARHVRAGALAQNAAGLEKMARRIEPDVGFDDLVLTETTLVLLQELVARIRHRERVLGEWRMRPGGGRGQGVIALFAGESGTGKTMSAEVIAGELGLELYTINLATVVDKYIGETEKNLERIFAEVDGVNGVLLFDEADALFGKRSEVRDAHDRYANIEVAYLLQRIETFDGLAILATNLRANVDEAFIRRLDTVVDFPFPDVEQRKLLWQQCLGSTIPIDGDVDLDFLARSFELSGGNIRSIALTAAYLAADRGGSLSMADLVRAVHREYRKLGRLSVRAEFGEWFSVIARENG
jgi:AAA+ superfamily predicted ATPase